MLKAAVWQIAGIPPKMKRRESSAAPTAPETSCECPGAFTSPGKTTTRFASIRMLERRHGCFILAALHQLPPNEPGKDIPLLNGNLVRAHEGPDHREAAI